MIGRLKRSKFFKLAYKYHKKIVYYRPIRGIKNFNRSLGRYLIRTKKQNLNLPQ